VADDPLNPRRCAELLGALASPDRLRIVRYLREGPRNVGEIAEHLKDKAVNVSHHLNVLRHAGLVQNEKQGRFVIYSLAPGVLAQAEECDRLQLGCCQLDLPREGEAPAEPGALARREPRPPAHPRDK
jgi:DNA-binding transcriptional ArsR family regulator